MTSRITLVSVPDLERVTSHFSIQTPYPAYRETLSRQKVFYTSSAGSKASIDGVANYAPNEICAGISQHECSSTLREGKRMRYVLCGERVVPVTDGKSTPLFFW